MESLYTSLLLFRQVKIVPVADDVSDDILHYAVADASSNPFCVLFPLRFARGARLYREHNQDVPVVLLEGRFAEGTNPSFFGIGSATDDYFIYKTDISGDFFHAGLVAAAIDGEKNGRFVVFVEPGIQSSIRDAFLDGLGPEKSQKVSFFTSFSQFYEIPDISCVIIAGIGHDYMEKYTGNPVIYFTWINPMYLPADVFMIFNDSPWAQAIDAVKMVSLQERKGVIGSKRVLIKGSNLDKNVRSLLKNIGENQ